MAVAHVDYIRKAAMSSNLAQICHQSYIRPDSDTEAIWDHMGAHDEQRYPDRLHSVHLDPDPHDDVVIHKQPKATLATGLIEHLVEWAQLLVDFYYVCEMPLSWL